VRNNIKYQKIVLVGIVIMLSFLLFIVPFLNDTLAKSKKKIHSLSNDHGKHSNQKTECKVGIQTNNSCNNNNINIINIIEDRNNKTIFTQGELIAKNNSDGQEINNNTNKTLPAEESNSSSIINNLSSSSPVSNHCELVPGPNMTFISVCSNK
jgi:archaellum component FlaF (FlaF/FlaG flagellin family)